MVADKHIRHDAMDPRQVARELDRQKRALEVLLEQLTPRADPGHGREALTDVLQMAGRGGLAPPLFAVALESRGAVVDRAAVQQAILEVENVRAELVAGSPVNLAPDTMREKRELAQRATLKARAAVERMLVPTGQTAVSAISSTTEVAEEEGATTPTDPRIELADFIAPERGSRSLSAIIIGSAEGTRTAGGGMKSAYGHHSDPGNSRQNRGSFSMQGAMHLSPEQADREQQRKMQAKLPAYVDACKAAGIDPSNAVALVTYWDLFTIKPALAASFGALLPELKQRGLTFDAALELRVLASEHTQARKRWSGWEKIARGYLGKPSTQITDAEFWRVVRIVHAGRQTRMREAIAALGRTRQDT